MNTFYRKITTLFVLVLLMSSCVLQKEYNSLLTKKVSAEVDFIACTDSLSTANLKVNELQAANSKYLEKNTSLSNDLSQLKLSFESLEQQYKELNQYYDNLRNNSGQLNKNIDDQQQELLIIRENLEKSRKMNEVLNTDLIEREKKVAELGKILNDQANTINSLKTKITNSLLSFDESELKVSAKNGKVYISLAENLLFKSGSILIDPKGENALKKLAKTLQSQKQINIMVEGHTDNVPISKTTKHMNDNWDLSVLRATSIVRILTNNGVSKQQITAAGKGAFSPIADNKSSENRQKNRRTEIIIAPNLEELFTMLDIE